MKQRIVPEQLKELTDEQMQKLHTWWRPELGDYMTDFETEENGTYFVGICKYIKPGVAESPGYPLLNIGQMIGLLMDNKAFTETLDDGYFNSCKLITIDWPDMDEVELCDALWKAVKEVLLRM